MGKVQGVGVDIQGNIINNYHSFPLVLTKGLHNQVLEAVSNELGIHGPIIQGDVRSVPALLKEWISLRVLPEEAQIPGVLLLKAEWGVPGEEGQLAFAPFQRGVRVR